MKKAITAIVMMTLLVACSEKNSPTGSKRNDGPKTGVNVVFYASSLIYDNCDIWFCCVKEPGDTLLIPSSERPEPIDTAIIEDRYFIKSQNNYSNPLFLPISDYKVFQTTVPIEIAVNDTFTVFVKPVRKYSTVVTREDEYLYGNYYGNEFVKSSCLSLAMPAEDGYEVIWLNWHCANWACNNVDGLDEYFDNVVDGIISVTTMGITVQPTE